MGLFSFFRSLRASSPAAVQARVDAVHRRVASLDVASAESEVRDAVMMADPFHAEEPSSRSAWTPDADLPASVRSLFRTYERIAAGGMQLGRADVAVYDRDPSFIRIGSDLEHADVVVRRSDGRVFVIEDDGKLDLDLSDEHASVWHYLLEVAEHTRGDIDANVHRNTGRSG